MVDLINPKSDARAGLPRNRQEVRTEGTALNSKAHEHAIGRHCIILLPLCFTCFTLAKDEDGTAWCWHVYMWSLDMDQHVGCF